MKEFVLHHIWQYRLFVAHDQYCTDGQKVEVIHPGKPNRNAGPDFFNAKIKIGDTLWAGNVEIHLKSSDWFLHQHQNDSAYDNVILHVVQEADVEVFRSGGREIPQLILQYPPGIVSEYEKLMEKRDWISCSAHIKNFPEMMLTSWKDNLLIEKLSRKVDDIRCLLDANCNFRDEVMFVLLCRSFGFAVNGDAFEALAQSIPWTVFQKCRHNISELEALLFGQSGLMKNKSPDDEYMHELRIQYAFLQKKFQLQPMAAERWRLLRMRPCNFPHVRISQLAALLNRYDRLTVQLTEAADLPALMKLLKISAGNYWKSHYVFGVLGSERSVTFGKHSIHNVIINAVIPMMYARGMSMSDETLKDKALHFLAALPAEENHIIQRWKEHGLKVEHAADSQSLIHLYKYYCDERNCLRCRIGHQVLSRKANDLIRQ
jgi:hypothetical protein